MSDANVWFPSPPHHEPQSRNRHAQKQNRGGFGNRNRKPSKTLHEVGTRRRERVERNGVLERGRLTPDACGIPGRTGPHIPSTDLQRQCCARCEPSQGARTTEPYTGARRSRTKPRRRRGVSLQAAHIRPIIQLRNVRWGLRKITSYQRI